MCGKLQQYAVQIYKLLRAKTGANKQKYMNIQNL